MISWVRQVPAIADANELDAEWIWRSTKYFTPGYLGVHETTGRALSSGECIDLGRVQNRREAISSQEAKVKESGLVEGLHGPHTTERPAER